MTITCKVCGMQIPTFAGALDHFGWRHSKHALRFAIASGSRSDWPMLDTRSQVAIPSHRQFMTQDYPRGNWRAELVVLLSRLHVQLEGGNIC